MYFNPGPARLPYHHEGILSYCRELGVPLEVMSNDNRGALLQTDAAFDGQPQRNRQVVNDIRGYVAELAAKAIDQDALTQAVTTEDKERIRALLRSFGALDQDMAYKGSGRAGYSEPPGGGTQAGTRSQPLDLRKILDAGFWQFQTQFRRELASGGDDDAAGRRHGPHRRGVRPRARRHDHLWRGGARAAPHRRWRARRLAGCAGPAREHAIEAPLVVVHHPAAGAARRSRRISRPDIRAAIEAVDYVPAVKVAFQAERRFWELDEAIYGGISWTTRDITQVWYPSAGIHQRKGILVGAYIWSDDLGDEVRRHVARRAPRGRTGRRRTAASGLSPASDQGRVASPGRTSRSADRPGRNGAATRGRRTIAPLLKGDGPFLFAGEHMSYINGWQEGAVRSAHYSLKQIADANVCLNVNCYSAAATPACCGSTVSSRSRGATSRPNSVMFSAVSSWLRNPPWPKNSRWPMPPIRAEKSLIWLNTSSGVPANTVSVSMNCCTVARR